MDQLNEINDKYVVNIDGYTFNPSLFKKNGASNYLEYSKMIISECKKNQFLLKFCR